MGPTISATLLLLLLLTTTITAPAATTSDLSAAANLQELELMKSTLRLRGYTLFCNAISTSDLQLQFLSSSPTTASSSSNATTSASNFTVSGGTLASDFYTIFAPTDPYVYALDMASDAAAYVSTLRYHVIPNRRMMHAELRNLTTPFLETLLPRYSLLVNNNKNWEQNGIVLGDLNSADLDVVWVDGVRISDPDVYVGSRIVVHGINGILVTGIVKDEDLEDDERRPGLISGQPEAPVFSPVVTPAAPDSPMNRAEANGGRSPVAAAPGSDMTHVAAAPGSGMTHVAAAPDSGMTHVAAAPASGMTHVAPTPGSGMTHVAPAPGSGMTPLVAAAAAGPGMSPVVRTGSGKNVRDRVKETRHKKHYHSHNHHHHSRRNRGVRHPYRSSHNRKEDL